MKIAKSLILMLVLAGATYAGDIPTFDGPAVPPAASQKVSNGPMTSILVAIVQNLLSLR